MLREDVTTGSTFTLGGYADSLYEYLPKMHALLSGADPRFATLTRGFMDAAKRHLFFRPMVPENDDILISGTATVDQTGAPQLDPETEHLTCFIGGTFALAGRLLGSEEDIDVGAKLTNGCAYAYKSFPTGLMPERLNMIPCEYDEPCVWDEDRWVSEKEKRPEYRPHLPKGFTTAKDPRYILRPEAIESVFYMYRITGDAKWAETAWDMFLAVASGTGTELASAAVLDVTVAKWQLPLEDYMEVSLRCTPSSTFSGSNASFPPCRASGSPRR
jgi:mannosyl-oligosaccharide alpha-1,2-mannosidase